MLRWCQGLWKINRMTQCFYKHQQTDGGKELLRKLKKGQGVGQGKETGLCFALVAKTDGACELSRPQSAAGVYAHLHVCEGKCAGSTLCTISPSGRPLLRRDAKSFLVSNLASATLRSLALPLPFTYLYPLPHPLMSLQQYFLLLSASREEENIPVVYLALHSTCTAQ